MDGKVAPEDEVQTVLHLIGHLTTRSQQCYTKSSRLPNMNQTRVVFIGIKGRVLAIDRATGQEVWRTPLKGGDFVNVVIEDGELYAATKGELFRLDPATGAILWQNGLQGLGRDLISIASSGAGGAAVIREKRRRDEAATAVGAAAAAGA